MPKKVKLQCAKCGTKGMSLVPPDEVSFRVDQDKRFVCWRCCKAIRWKSSCCDGCSDFASCAGKFKDKFKEFIEDTKGV